MNYKWRIASESYTLTILFYDIKNVKNIYVRKTTKLKKKIK